MPEGTSPNLALLHSAKLANRVEALPKVADHASHEVSPNRAFTSRGADFTYTLRRRFEQLKRDFLQDPKYELILPLGRTSILAGRQGNLAGTLI